MSVYHLLFVYNVCFVGLYVSIATVCGEQINRAFWHCSFNEFDDDDDDDDDDDEDDDNW